MDGPPSTCPGTSNASTVGLSLRLHLGGLGSRLLAMDPEFDPRTYGCAKLTTLIEQAGGFEVRRGGGMSVQVRRRDDAQPA